MYYNIGVTCVLGGESDPGCLANGTKYIQWIRVLYYVVII